MISRHHDPMTAKRIFRNTSTIDDKVNQLWGKFHCITSRCYSSCIDLEEEEEEKEGKKKRRKRSSPNIL